MPLFLPLWSKRQADFYEYKNSQHIEFQKSQIYIVRSHLENKIGKEKKK